MPRGSKPGERRGGRTKGIPNKRTAETIAKVEASGLMPLDYMLSVLRNEHAAPELRMDAAHKAAPYVHARLTAIEHSGGIETNYVMAMPDVAESPKEWLNRTSKSSGNPN